LSLNNEEQAQAIDTLTQFIDRNPEPRELKRALAIKMSLEGISYQKIQQILGMSPTRISVWKKQFIARGLEGIKLGYQGKKSYLSSEEIPEVLEWLQEKESYLLEELVAYIDANYGVIYRSKQSYYDLFKKAKISWHKSQKWNPKHDSDLVDEKKRSDPARVSRARERAPTKKFSCFWNRTGTL